MRTLLHATLGILGALLAYAPSEALPQETPRPVRWEQITTDLEIAQTTVPVNPILSSELLFLRSSMQKYRVGIIQAREFGWRRNTVAALGGASRAAVAINANFFDEQGRPLGLVISRGILSQKVHLGGGTLSGIIQSGLGGVKILSRPDFNPAGVSDAIQAGPRLLSSGVKVRGIRGSSTLSKRSGLCVDRQGRLVMFVVSSGLLGVSLEQLQDELQRPGIDCLDALNLDGGGSSQLWVNGSIQGAPNGFEEISIQASDPVPVAFALFPKESSPLSE
jgi:hypothetical protein